MGKEILTATGQGNHREGLELQAARRLAIALVDDTVLVNAPVAEGAYRLPVRLQSLGIHAGKPLDGNQRQIVGEIPCHPVHVAETDRRVLSVGSSSISRLHDDSVHDLLLLVGHPFAAEIERQAEVHVGHEAVHSAPAGDGSGAVVGSASEFGITELVVLIDQRFAQLVVIRDGSSGSLAMLLVSCEQAVEGHRGQALGHIGDMGTVDARLLPLELVGDVAQGGARRDVPFESGKIPGGEFPENLPIAGRGIPPAFFEKLLHHNELFLSENALLHMLGHRRDILGAEQHAGIDPGRGNFGTQERGVEPVGVVGGLRNRGPLCFRAVEQGEILVRDRHMVRPDSLPFESRDNGRGDGGIGESVRRVEKAHHAVQK